MFLTCICTFSLFSIFLKDAHAAGGRCTALNVYIMVDVPQVMDGKLCGSKKNNLYFKIRCIVWALIKRLRIDNIM